MRRTNSLKFLVLLGLAIMLCPKFIWSQTASAKPCVVKFRETGVKFSQLDGGYFQGYYSLWREAGLAYIPTFVESEFAIGYSPWRSALNIEANGRVVLMVVSFGGGFGYCTRTDFSENQFFIKPEIGLNLSVVQIYYTYSLVTPNNNLYNIDSNLTLAIPIASTTHFGSCENTKRWKMLGVIHSVFRGEHWQIWE